MSEAAASGGDGSQAAPNGQPAQTQQAPTPQGQGGKDRHSNGTFAPKASAPTSTGLKDAAAQVGKPSSEKAAPAPSPTEKAEAAAEKRLKLKLKVNGKDEDWEGTEEDLQRDMQKGRAYELTVKQERQVADKARRLLQLAKDNPEAMLAELGHDFDSLAEARLSKRAQDALKSPEQLAIEERDRKIQEYEAREAQRQEEAEAAAREHMDKQLWQEAEPQWMAALQAMDLDKDAWTLREMARVGKEAHAIGYDLTPAQMAQEVRAKEEKRFTRYVANLSAERLVKKLGPAKMREILQFSVAQLQSQPAFSKPSSTPAPRTERESSTPDYVSESEWRRRLREQG
jgi:hypothetical protein